MRQGVRAFRLKGIRRQRRGDRVVCYHRATGIRLPDLREDHPDFIAAWAAAEAGGADRPLRASAGSIAALCEAFAGSAEYRRQSAGYRAILRLHLDAIRAAYGMAPAGGLRPKHIAADLAKLEGSRPVARLKTWRKLTAFAAATGMVEEDAARAVRAPRFKSAGHPPWSRDEIARFRAHWPIGSSNRACFELLLWTAARTIDAVAIGPQHVGRDGVLVFRQHKTGGLAHVPWTAPLPSWAAGWAAERQDVLNALAPLAGTLTFAPVGDRPRSVKGISNTISAAAKAAGIEGRTAHGLRKARLTLIAEAGGSAHAIMAWGGHATLAEATHYTRSADAKRLVTGNGTVTSSYRL